MSPNISQRHDMVSEFFLNENNIVLTFESILY
jgi:hypothetical protein